MLDEQNLYNPYVGMGNNPVGNVDPMGLWNFGKHKVEEGFPKPGKDELSPKPTKKHKYPVKIPTVVGYVTTGYATAKYQKAVRAHESKLAKASAPKPPTPAEKDKEYRDTYKKIISGYKKWTIKGKGWALDNVLTQGKYVALRRGYAKNAAAGKSRTEYESAFAAYAIPPKKIVRGFMWGGSTRVKGKQVISDDPTKASPNTEVLKAKGNYAGSYFGARVFMATEPQLPWRKYEGKPNRVIRSNPAYQITKGLFWNPAGGPAKQRVEVGLHMLSRKKTRSALTCWWEAVLMDKLGPDTWMEGEMKVVRRAWDIDEAYNVVRPNKIATQSESDIGQMLYFQAKDIGLDNVSSKGSYVRIRFRIGEKVVRELRVELQ